MKSFPHAAESEVSCNLSVSESRWKVKKAQALIPDCTLCIHSRQKSAGGLLHGAKTSVKKGRKIPFKSDYNGKEPIVI